MTRSKSHRQTGLAATAVRLVRTGILVALCALLGGSLSADDRVFSNKARFRIPYQLDAAEIARLNAEEIQLHVSTDAGLTWRHVDSVPPVQGKFTFEAARDGDYWFSVRTIGQDGRRHPSGPLTAGLKVHVDTTRPTLSLHLAEASPGRAALRWAVEDRNLDLDSLILESRHTETGSWETVPVVPTDSGETTWSVPAGGTVSVRGRIMDLAGNQQTEQASTGVTPVAVPEIPAASQVRRPIATSQPNDGRIEQERFRREGNRGHLQTYTTANEGGLPLIQPNGTENGQGVSQPAGVNAPEQKHSAPRPDGWPARHAGGRPDRARNTSSERTPVRRVNSTSFKIAYILDDVGPSGVSSVDLYLSEDGGQKWFHYGADDDGQSPFDVTVPRDGDYGFAIRVRSGVGLAEPPPQPGDPAEMAITVDRTPPRVTLLPLKQGHDEQPSQLLIEWTATDEALADRPVALFYAARPQGPWHPITGWDSNSGRHLWKFGTDIPNQVYIRIDARDAAGNVTRVDSPEPLLIDLSRPSARIIDVESVSPAG